MFPGLGSMPSSLFTVTMVWNKSSQTASTTHPTEMKCVKKTKQVMEGNRGIFAW